MKGINLAPFLRVLASRTSLRTAALTVIRLAASNCLQCSSSPCSFRSCLYWPPSQPERSRKGIRKLCRLVVTTTQSCSSALASTRQSRLMALPRLVPQKATTSSSPWARDLSKPSRSLYRTMRRVPTASRNRLPRRSVQVADGIGYAFERVG